MKIGSPTWPATGCEASCRRSYGGAAGLPLMWHQPWDGILIKGWSQQPNLPVRRPFPPIATSLPRQQVRSILNRTRRNTLMTVITAKDRGFPPRAFARDKKCCSAARRRDSLETTVDHALLRGFARSLRDERWCHNLTSVSHRDDLPMKPVAGRARLVA